MPMTLAELSVQTRDPLHKGVLDTLIMESDLMGLVPFETLGAMAVESLVVDTLPTIEWRKLNEGWTESTGTTKRIKDSVYFLGGDFDVDRNIVKVTTGERTGPAMRAAQLMMKIKAMAYEFNDVWINGDQTVDPDEFNGLKVRLTDIGGDQENQVSTGGDFDIDASDANRKTFLREIDQSIYEIDGHGRAPLFALMNKQTWLQLNAIFRELGLLMTTTDQFGRTFQKYANLTLLDAGVKADQSTLIITNTETKGGGTAESSIYLMRFGVGTHLWGIQQYPLDSRDLGEVDDKPVMRTRVEWPVGMAHANDKSMARVYGFTAV